MSVLKGRGHPYAGVSKTSVDAAMIDLGAVGNDNVIRRRCFRSTKSY